MGARPQAKTHPELLQADKTTRSWQKTRKEVTMIVAGDIFALGQPNGQVSTALEFWLWPLSVKRSP